MVNSKKVLFQIHRLLAMPSRIVDKSKIRYWLLIIILAILGNAWLLDFLTPIKNGIAPTFTTNEIPNFWTCLYFSITTITTLGYGDYRPIGYGRILSSVEVICGVISIAIVVSKLASDRTSTFVKLIYSSDNERRLRQYKNDIEDCSDKLKQALRDHDHLLKMECINSLKLLVINFYRYYNYQLTVGAIGEEWAKKNSLQITRAITEATQVVMLAGKDALASLKERKKIKTTLDYVKKTIAILSTDDVEDESFGLRQQVEILIQSYDQHVASEKHRYIYTEITPALLIKIRENLPVDWPKNYHKTVATELRISNKLAHRALMQIIEEDT